MKILPSFCIFVFIPGVFNGLSSVLALFAFIIKDRIFYRLSKAAILISVSRMEKEAVRSRQAAGSSQWGRDPHRSGGMTLSTPDKEVGSVLGLEDRNAVGVSLLFELHRAHNEEDPRRKPQQAPTGEGSVK